MFCKRRASPALLKPKTGEGFADVKALITPNPLIGALEEVQFTDLKITIPDNSLLYILSDGVYEIEKTDGHMWPFDEFKAYMASQDRDLGTLWIDSWSMPEPSVIVLNSQMTLPFLGWR